MQENNTIKTLREDLSQLLGDLDKQPQDFHDIQKLSEQLQHLLGSVDNLKERISTL